MWGECNTLWREAEKEDVQRGLIFKERNRKCQQETEGGLRKYSVMEVEETEYFIKKRPVNHPEWPVAVLDEIRQNFKMNKYLKYLNFI